MNWLSENWPILVFIILLPSIINGIRGGGTIKSRIMRVLAEIVDRLSILTPRNIPSAFKLPLTRSKSPVKEGSADGADK